MDEKGADITPKASASAGLAHCIRMLAWADEQSKTNGGDPVYALERCIEDISHKGR